ncbi:hypothetical protein [Sphingopyxis macrogoltabida]|uniref:Uncharacterized protein n=1 Tax=Sphingopyxis macrogoltabida TaxID=33050 RepID=A0A0N9UB22_SPHMC|nr:hypothetical protein [Sphingopyxis macrogoltabida]ALH82610.1 hypothetical protein AN936_20300 [Sphingopyxis macrogoltabida]
MKIANITAAVAILLWFGLAILGRNLLIDALTDDVPDWPTVSSIDFGIILPMSLASALLAWAWLCNGFLRRPWALAVPSVMCLATMLPYFMVMGGGV